MEERERKKERDREKQSKIKNDIIWRRERQSKITRIDKREIARDRKYIMIMIEKGERRERNRDSMYVIERQKVRKLRIEEEI
jgi:hypothetical protein